MSKVATAREEGGLAKISPEIVLWFILSLLPMVIRAVVSLTILGLSRPQYLSTGIHAALTTAQNLLSYQFVIMNALAAWVIIAGRKPLLKRGFPYIAGLALAATVAFYVVEIIWRLVGVWPYSDTDYLLYFIPFEFVSALLAVWMYRTILIRGNYELANP